MSSIGSATRRDRIVDSRGAFLAIPGAGTSLLTADSAARSSTALSSATTSASARAIRSSARRAAQRAKSSVTGLALLGDADLALEPLQALPQLAVLATRAARRDLCRPRRHSGATRPLSHQLIPISRARSTDAISSRSLIVSSSMSSRLIWMSPAMTMPLSSTRSRMSARLASADGRPGSPPAARFWGNAAFHALSPPRRGRGRSGGFACIRAVRRPHRAAPRMSPARRWCSGCARARRRRP